MKKSHLIYMIVAIVLVVVVPIGLMLWNQAHPSKTAQEQIYYYNSTKIFELSLEKVEPFYTIKPYDQLLPHTIPQGFTLKAARCERPTEPDTYWYELLGPIQGLYLEYIHEDGGKLTVYVDDFKNTTIALGSKPETYSLKTYYEESHDQNYYFTYSSEGTFYPEDITLETVAARIYSGEQLKQDYACYASVGFVVNRKSYITYTYQGNNITAEDLYEMITSAKYFQK